MSSPGDNVIVELYLDSVWTAITSYVRIDPPLEIRFGVRGEAGIADPAECALVVNNFDGRFTPKNAAGAWYGLIKRGIPLRLTYGSAVRFIGEVNEFPNTWDPSGADIWVPLLASGPLRRLLRSNTLDSTLYTFFSRQSSITGYWPVEDEVGSTVFASGLAGGTPLTYDGSPVMQGVTGGVGSGPIATWAGVAAFAPVTASLDQFTVGFLLNMPTGGTFNTASLLKWVTGGTAHTWEISYETTAGGSIRLKSWSGPTPTLDLNIISNFSLDGNTRYVLLECVQNGANVDYALTATNTFPVTGTLNSRTITSPSLVVVGAGNAITGNVGIGHVFTSNDNNTLTGFSFTNALLAYAGESVEDRMARIAALAPITIGVDDSSEDTTRLGPQPAGSPLGVMRDAELADAGGILRDSLSTLNALNYISRTSRYNDATPNLALNYASGHLSPPLEPTDDDQLLANDVTVTRTDGSSARAVDTTGPLNSSAWPTGVGLYQKSATLNVYADSVLPALAGWLLALGTIDETRFPVLTIDLIKNPSLVTDFDALRPGHTVTITNLPSYAGGASLVVLHCLGWTERISSHVRTVELNCTPASVYDVVVLNDSTFGRLDSSTTTTNEVLDTTETGVDYTGGSWITTATHPSEFPFDILIGGELMSVTSATASVFTVTRSVNGVVKSHLTGQPVHIARPIRVAL